MQGSMVVPMAFICIMLTGCGKHQQTLSPSQKMLVSGHWYTKSIDTVIGHSDYKTIYGTGYPSACDSQSWIQFNADGSDSSFTYPCPLGASYLGAWRLYNDTTIEYILNGTTVTPKPTLIHIISGDSIQLFSDPISSVPPNYILRSNMNHKE